MESGLKVSFGMRINDLQKAAKTVKKEALELHNLKGYTAFVNGNVYMPDNRIVKADLLFRRNKLIAINDIDEKKLSTKSPISFVDLKDKYLTPGIIDQHIHGAFGINFNTAGKKEIQKLLKELNKQGYSEILATLIPDTVNNINRQMKIISEVMKAPQKDSTRILGINLEGPFLNPEKSGIHVPGILMRPSIDNFKKVASPDVKMVTLAPELDRNYELSHYLNEKGIIASAGHTDATADDIKKSEVKQITHLFNTMPPLHHRNSTATNEALSNKGLYTEVICDLHHVSPQMMNLTYDVRPKGKIILISDALEGAHTDKDYFFMNDVKINIVDDMAKNNSGTLAGSIKLISDMAKRLVSETKIKFKDFIRFSSTNPAQNLGVESRYQIKPGSKPNFMIWDKNLKPEKTFNA